jgi:hypothetical protein
MKLEDAEDEALEALEALAALCYRIYKVLLNFFSEIDIDGRRNAC